MSNDQKSTRTCPECGSTEIVRAVSVTKTAESGSVGLSYKCLGILRGTEPLYADLCHKCGTIVRLFVKETDKKWDSD